jgi:hypothetical protein
MIMEQKTHKLLTVFKFVRPPVASVGRRRECVTSDHCIVKPIVTGLLLMRPPGLTFHS